MKVPLWIPFVAKKWLFSGKGRSTSAVLAITGIAIGVSALIVVLAAMNGFQSGFVNSILQISSFHIRIQNHGGPRWDDKFASRVASIPKVKSVLPFYEMHALARSAFGRNSPVIVRIVPDDALERDPDFFKAINYNSAFPAAGKGRWPYVLAGVELARYLELQSSDLLSVTFVSASTTEGIAAYDVKFSLQSLFQSGYYEIDSNLIVIPYSQADAILQLNQELDWVYGIKLQDRYDDEITAQEIESQLKVPAHNIQIWRDYNRAFFSALAMEKTIMTFLLGLIFLIVAVNIYQTMRRHIFEKIEEIAILQAMGCSEYLIRGVFAFHAMVIGFAGALIGLVAGLLVTVNINSILSAFDTIFRFVSSIRLPGTHSSSTALEMLASRDLYLLQIPTVVVFQEVFLIFLAAVFSAVIAALAAMRQFAGARPSEILRYE